MQVQITVLLLASTCTQSQDLFEPAASFRILHGDEHVVDHVVSEDTHTAEVGDEGHEEGGAHGGHEGHEGHEGHHSHGHSGEGEIGFSIGSMLIGAVAFQMSLFYLVNNKDEDIKRYSWIIIEITISIFSAVMIFEAWEGVVDLYIYEPMHLTPVTKLLANLVHCLCWFAFMQVFVLAVALNEKQQSVPYKALQEKQGYVEDTNTSSESGASTRELIPSTENASGHREAKKGSMSGMVLNAKCWGGLVAHIAAFASIVAFDEMMMLASEEFGSIGVYVSPLICIAFFGVLFWICGKIRTAIIFADGSVDDVEKVWMHVVNENEDDVCALCASYLLSRCAQFAIEGTGKLPGEHEHEKILHSNGQIFLLFVVAIVWAGIMVLLILWEQYTADKADAAAGHGHHNDGQEHHAHGFCGRAFEVAQLVSSFAFAWCGLMACTWKVHHAEEALHWIQVWTEVVEALMVSLGSVGIIFMFDRIADLKSTPPQVDQSIRDLILALGVLIGFSWEHAFHMGVVDIVADQTIVNAHLAQFFGGLSVTVIVLPAFRWYIVPLVFKLKEEKDAQAHHGKRMTERLNAGEQKRHRG